jgi:hypothetical protein
MRSIRESDIQQPFIAEALIVQMHRVAYFCVNHNAPTVARDKPLLLQSIHESLGQYDSVHITES